MDKDLFVEKLKALVPSLNDLKNSNLPESYVKQFIARYHCESNFKADIRIISNDELLHLIQQYNCSDFAVGNLTFLSTINEDATYYQIGNVEMDILVLNKITHEIELRDHDQPDHVLWHCASNSARFLETLLLCAAFFSRFFSEPTLDDDNEYIFSVVKQCADQAGGEKYINFYKMLLGYFL